MPNRRTSLFMRPLCNQLVLLINAAVNYVWDDAPSGRAVEPNAAPIKVGIPIRFLAASPNRKSTVV